MWNKIDSKILRFKEYLKKIFNDESLSNNGPEYETAKSVASLFSSEDYAKRLSIKVDLDAELDLIVKSKSRKLWRRYAIAASFLLPLAIGSYFFYTAINNQNESPNSFQYKDAGAILVMGDGRSVNLTDSVSVIDSTINGISYNSSGLVYEKTEQELIADTTINKLIVGRGYEYMVVLNDGTKVWLNSDSQLDYPTTFGKDERRVTLSGEAYFDVTHDETSPFYVDIVGGVTVKVLGTSFDVCAYKDEPYIKTTLVRGKVMLSTFVGEEVVLEPSFQAVVSTDGSVSVYKVDVDNAVAWHDGWFFFEGESLQGVLKTISRWYDVDFEIGSDVTEQYIVSGKIKRFENLNYIIDMMEQIVPLKFTVYGEKILINLNH